MLIDIRYQSMTGMVGMKLFRVKLRTARQNIKTMRNPLQHIRPLFCMEYSIFIQGVYMYKLVVLFMFSLTLIIAKENPLVLQYTGVHAVHKHSEHDVEIFHIQRVQPSQCLDIEMSPENLYDEDLSSANIDKNCKKTLTTTVGKVQPMKIANGIRTVGEIEVLDFIKNRSSKNPQKYLLIDSRKTNWYEHSTIPSAVNLPYTDMEYDEDFEEEYTRMLGLLSIKKIEGKFDFSKAKTVLLFCNGNWCGQSPTAIKTLLKMGYPAKKILWYRGGLQSWIMLGFNTIKPK